MRVLLNFKIVAELKVQGHMNFSAFLPTAPIRGQYLAVSMARRSCYC